MILITDTYTTMIYNYIYALKWLLMSSKCIHLKSYNIYIYIYQLNIEILKMLIYFLYYIKY